MNKIQKIVITGAPCTGKTEIIKNLKVLLEQKYFKVLIVPETATNLYFSGFDYDNLKTEKGYFQNVAIKLQYFYEELVFKHAEKI